MRTTTDEPVYWSEFGALMVLLSFGALWIVWRLLALVVTIRQAASDSIHEFLDAIAGG